MCNLIYCNLCFIKKNTVDTEKENQPSINAQFHSTKYKFQNPHHEGA